MEQAAIAGRRLISQQIAKSAADRPEEAVRALGAVQAQDFLGSLWAVGLRTPGATEPAIERALAERTIVRTWPMRGTIHLVAAADVRWMLELLAPRVVQRTASRRAQLEIDEPTVAASAALLSQALAGGRQLARGAIYELLGQHGIATANSRGLHILGRLAHDGLICFGAREGKQPTFALLDEWAPSARSLPRDEALAMLALRYFSGHGPATVSDLMWWSGLTTKEASAGLADAAAQLGREQAGGQTYYFAQDARAAAPAPDAAFLLPPFDEFLVGYRDRSAVIDTAGMERVAPGSNGIFHPIVVLGGRVVGTWRREIKRDRVLLSFSLFGPLDSAQSAAVAAAGERYGQFLGLPAAIGL
jgi:hypothetical protein